MWMLTFRHHNLLYVQLHYMCRNVDYISYAELFTHLKGTNQNHVIFRHRLIDLDKHECRSLKYVRWVPLNLLKVRGYVTRVKGSKLPVNNHSSFFVCLNIFVFRNMMSVGNKRRCLATTASNHCFAL